MPVKVLQTEVTPPFPVNSNQVDIIKMIMMHNDDQNDFFQPGVSRTLLYNGSRFTGHQKSKGNQYDVEVMLQVKPVLNTFVTTKIIAQPFQSFNSDLQIIYLFISNNFIFFILTSFSHSNSSWQWHCHQHQLQNTIHLTDKIKCTISACWRGECIFVRISEN